MDPKQPEKRKRGKWYALVGGVLVVLLVCFVLSVATGKRGEDAGPAEPTGTTETTRITTQGDALEGVSIAPTALAPTSTAVALEILEPSETPGPTETATPTAEPTIAPSPVPTEVPPVAVAERVPAQMLRVIDGDTIEVSIEGQAYTVRYIGIDTPETVHPDKEVEWMGPQKPTGGLWRAKPFSWRRTSPRQTSMAACFATSGWGR